MGILSIDRIANSLAIRFSEKSRINPESLMKLLAENPNAKFTPNGVLKVKMSGENDDLAKQVFRTLNELISQFE